MKTITFDINSGSVDTYRVEDIQKVRLFKESQYTVSIVRMRIYTEVGNITHNFLKFEHSEGSEGVLRKDRLDNTISSLIKLLDVGFLDESAFKIYLEYIRDYLCEFYDKQTDFMENKLNERIQHFERIEEKNKKSPEEFLEEVNELLGAI